MKAHAQIRGKLTFFDAMDPAYGNGPDCLGGFAGLSGRECFPPYNAVTVEVWREGVGWVLYAPAYKGGIYGNAYTAPAWEAQGPVISIPEPAPWEVWGAVACIVLLFVLAGKWGNR
jgi:hypothetical protein